MAKKSDHIRIRPNDKKTWKEYCDILGEKSPDLFNKIINSKELKLNDRILQELQKKEEILKRRAGF